MAKVSEQLLQAGTTPAGGLTSRIAAYVACALSLAATATPAGNGYWIEPAPRGPDDAALAGVVERSAFGSAATRIAALRAFSQARPGTAVSGLAQIEAARLLVEERRFTEAAQAARHADVALSALHDRALLTLAQALEGAGQLTEAATAYAAAAQAAPGGPQACPATLGEGAALLKAGRPKDAVDVLSAAADSCRQQRPAALAALARAHEARPDLRAAALVYDQLDREYPASPEARATAPRLATLARHLPTPPTQERLLRPLATAEALLEAGLGREALAVLRPLAKQAGTGDGGDRWRVALGRALAATGRRREALAEWGRVLPGSAYEVEAAFRRARSLDRAEDRLVAYEELAARFPTARFAEQALLTIAHHYQKDARHELALPYYRRLATLFPDGPWARQAAWRVAWADLRQGRHEEAAEAMERAARRWPDARETPAFLYWAGRAREALGQRDVAAAIFTETIRRYKHAYHGMRAADALRRLPPLPVAPDPSPTPGAGLAWTSPPAIPEPALARVRELLVVGRIEDAIAELGTVPATPVATATIGWLEWRRGRLRPAIVAMKRAYPWYVSEAGDALPVDMWRILYPLGFGDIIETKSHEEGLDPALVAALICQESTFDANALSPVGARGLMQIMPPTGRAVARVIGVPFKPRDLGDPSVSLDFGTHYLAGLLARYGDRIDRALAAYNAGPNRVDQWMSPDPEMSSEVFIENIPFSETRHYVATVLANQAHYRRIYSLAPRPEAARSASQP